MTYQARFAQPVDAERVIQFIRQADLRIDGIAETIEHFVLLEDDNKQIKITLGIEPIGEIGILRSLVITNGVSDSDLFIVFTKILFLAKEKQLKQLYLATNKYSALFFLTILGFQSINKECLPQQLFQSSHFMHNFEKGDVDFMQLNL